MPSQGANQTNGKHFRRKYYLQYYAYNNKNLSYFIRRRRAFCNHEKHKNLQLCVCVCACCFFFSYKPWYGCNSVISQSQIFSTTESVFIFRLRVNTTYFPSKTVRTTTKPIRNSAIGETSPCKNDLSIVELT